MTFKKRKSAIVGLAGVLVGATLLGPSVAFGASDPDDLVHYRPTGAFIGDVHPFYDNGTYHLFSLKTDGTYLS